MSNDLRAERRRRQRWPRMVEVARTPAERLVALFEGDVKAAAEVCGSTSSMLYTRRREYGGSLPADRVEEIRLALAERGIPVSRAFLTEEGQFETPAREGVQ